MSPSFLRDLVRLPARSLVTRIVASFAGLAVVVLVAVASVAFVLQRRSLEANALARLSTVAAVKEGEINRWVANQVDLLHVLAGLSETRRAAEATVAGEDPTALAVLEERVDWGSGAGSDIEEMFFLSTSGGRVLASSDRSRVGSYHVDDLYYVRGMEGTYVQNVYPSRVTGRPTLTVATPVVGASGNTVAVLVAHLNLGRVDRILAETEMVGATAMAYAVSRSNDVISSERFGLPELRRGIHTEGVERALRGESGQGPYGNFRGRPVLGAYRWMGDREIALVLEMDEAEALAPVRANLLGILGVGLVATLVLLLGVARIGHRVARSLSAVSDAAAQVAGGAFDVTVDAGGEDEVGRLGRAFNAMTQRLSGLYGDLQGQIAVNRRVLLALEEGRALLEAIVQNSSALIAVFHAESGVVLANQALEEALGVKPDALLGRNLADLLPDAEVKVHQAAQSRALEEDRAVEGEIHLRVGGDDRTFYAVWFPLRDSRRVPFSVGLIATDISERVRAEDEKKRYEAQLRHTQKLESLGVLAGGIAHDFNNILAAILGHADLAREMVPEASEEARHLTQVVRASERAATLTNQMLAYAGRASFQVEVLDLSEAVREVWSLLSVAMGKKVRLEQELSSDPCAVRADPAQISQIVMNLVTNADQAIGDEPGTVTVRTSTEVVADVTPDGLAPGRYVRLTVRDTGCGMDESTVDRIFDPFFTTKEAGRGLGLAAVMGIVKGLSGAVCVDSAPGHGTSFDVFLPQAAEASVGTADPGMRVPTGRGATVLLADDEEAVRDLARIVLEKAGHAVIDARDGVDALRCYREAEGAVSAAVLDVSMPGLGGREVLEELRKMDPALPVIFVTGYDPHDAVRDIAADPAVRLLQKPYRSSDLLATLAEVLEPIP